MLEQARKLPFQRGALVEDERTGRRGRLMDVVIERGKDGRVIKRTAFIRPEGGGCEWEAPFASISAVSS